ncbi:MAG TPA: HAMP domain-containing sensor histidine kinase [Gemmatimonadales bacterium]
MLVAANRAASFAVAARWVLHDLRSPAQSLTLIADLMTDPATEVEEILRDSCRRLAHAIELLARVMQPAAPADIGPIAVQEAIGFIADLHRAARFRAALELSIQPSLPAAAGIGRHLEHALLNLLLNAMAALRSRDDGIIRMAAAQERGHLAITVADDGPGLPPAAAERLFQRLRPRETDPLSGIGLLVAREVMRLSGGSLDHAPDTGPGARFVITLPIWRREALPRSAP